MPRLAATGPRDPAPSRRCTGGVSPAGHRGGVQVSGPPQAQSRPPPAAWRSGGDAPARGGGHRWRKGRSGPEDGRATPCPLHWKGDEKTGRFPLGKDRRSDISSVVGVLLGQHLSALEPRQGPLCPSMRVQRSTQVVGANRAPDTRESAHRQHPRTPNHRQTPIHGSRIGRPPMAVEGVIPVFEAIADGSWGV